jgi:hypothetical protein
MEPILFEGTRLLLACLRCGTPRVDKEATWILNVSIPDIQLNSF